jgi:osmotically-inducible protein OsmY
MARVQRRNDDSDTFNSYRDYRDDDRERRGSFRTERRDDRDDRDDRDRGFYNFETGSRDFDRDREDFGSMGRGNRESFGYRNFRNESEDNWTGRYRGEEFRQEDDETSGRNRWGSGRGYEAGQRDAERWGYGRRDRDDERGYWSESGRGRNLGRSEYQRYAGQGFDDRGEFSPGNRYGQDFGQQSFEGYGQGWNQGNQGWNQGAQGNRFSSRGQRGQGSTSGQGFQGQTTQGSFMGGGNYGMQGSQWNPSQERSHAGLGPKNYKRSDDRIKEDMCEALSNHPWIDASNTEVEVKNGVVTLTGTVNDRRTRQMMEDLADDIPGVKDVECQVKIETKTKAGMMGSGEKSGERSGEKSGDKDHNKSGNSGATQATRDR